MSRVRNSMKFSRISFFSLACLGSEAGWDIISAGQSPVAYVFDI